GIGNPYGPRASATPRTVRWPTLSGPTRPATNVGATASRAAPDGAGLLGAAWTVAGLLLPAGRMPPARAACVVWAEATLAAESLATSPATTSGPLGTIRTATVPKTRSW